MRKKLVLTISALLCLVISTTLPIVAQTHNFWTSGSSMPTAVQGPMTGVISGRIYVVGGFNAGGVVSDNQIYDPTTDTWSTGSGLPVATEGGVGAVVKGILYILGGYTQVGCCEVTNAVWAYDPRTDTWSSRSAMPTARGSEAKAIENNIVYVIGGNSASVLRLNTVESYNPATDTWTELAPLQVGKSEGGALAVYTDQRHSSGGNGRFGTWGTVGCGATPLRNGA